MKGLNCFIWNIKRVDFQDPFILCKFILFPDYYRKVWNFADFRITLMQIYWHWWPFGLSSGLDCCTVEPCLRLLHSSKTSSSGFLWPDLKDPPWLAVLMGSFSETKSQPCTLNQMVKSNPESGSHGGLKLQNCWDSSLKSLSLYFPTFCFLSSSNLRINLFFPAAFSSSEVLVAFDDWIDVIRNINSLNSVVSFLHHAAFQVKISALF